MHKAKCCGAEKLMFSPAYTGTEFSTTVQDKKNEDDSLFRAVLCGILPKYDAYTCLGPQGKGQGCQATATSRVIKKKNAEEAESSGNDGSDGSGASELGEPVDINNVICVVFVIRQ